MKIKLFYIILVLFFYFSCTYETNYCKVNFDANTNGGNVGLGTDYNQIIIVGLYAKKPVNNPNKYNYKFIGWFTNSIGGLPLNQFGPILNNTKFYAQYLKNPFVNNSKFIFDTLTGNILGFKPEFKNSTNILEIPDTIGEFTVKKIDNKAFINDSFITNVIISNNVLNIGDSAFFGCKKISNLILSNNLNSIGKYAFYNLKLLTNINIPNSLTIIGDYAFSFCSSITTFSFNNNIKTISSNLFNNCTSLNSVNLTNITLIDSNAFYSCSNLKNITIPNSVKIIKNNIFYGCSSLTSIIMNGVIPPTLTTSLSTNGLNNLLQIKVPNANVNDYKTAINWSNYSANIIGY